MVIEVHGSLAASAGQTGNGQTGSEERFHSGELVRNFVQDLYGFAAFKVKLNG